MCGIGLLIDIENRFDKKAVIREMCDLIAHRGPDHFGSYTDEKLAIGHRRLSIIDLSEGANQPFCKWDLVAAFNGEIYNYLEVRKILIQAGYTFDTESDTEVFLAAYHYWKENCFQYLNGMWAVIIYDIRAQQVILCRDRFGIKPLVYSKTTQFFAAGSEVKQLRSIGDQDSTVNEEVINDFVLFGALNYSGQTFWKEIQEVPAGGLIIYNLQDHSFQSSRWYQLEQQSIANRTYPDVLEEFRNAFLESLKLITRSDVKIGTLLSGGLDSSLILWGLHKLKLLNKVDCSFSSCFPGTALDESSFIDAMLASVPIASDKIFPLEHTESYHTIVKKLVYFHDQPVLTPSHLSEYFVFQEIHKQGYKVALGGQGVDEYLGGYRDFPYLYASGLLDASEYGSFMKFAYQRGKLEGIPFHRLARNYVSFSKQLKQVRQPTLPGWLNQKYASSFTLGNYSPAKTFDELVFQQIGQTSFPYQLHSEDRNSMMMSVESRQPFLDYKLVELGVSIPFRYKMKGSWTKSIIRDAFPELPYAVRRRKTKLGFPFPIDQFLKNNLENIGITLARYPDLYARFLSSEAVGICARGNAEELMRLDPALVFRLYALCLWQEVSGSAVPPLD